MEDLWKFISLFHNHLIILSPLYLFSLFLEPCITIVFVSMLDSLLKIFVGEPLITLITFLWVGYTRFVIVVVAIDNIPFSYCQINYSSCWISLAMKVFCQPHMESYNQLWGSIVWRLPFVLQIFIFYNERFDGTCRFVFIVLVVWVQKGALLSQFCYTSVDK